VPSERWSFSIYQNNRNRNKTEAAVRNEIADNRQAFAATDSCGEDLDEIVSSTSMHLFPRVAVFCVFSILPLDVVAEPVSDMSQPKSAIAVENVHVQPRGRGASPNSEDEDAVQTRITIFNEKQRLLDAEFDRKLRICRGC